MKRFSRMISVKASPDERSSRGGSNGRNDNPETTMKRVVEQFCGSGAPTASGGEEVLHLPLIVETAEASPAATAIAADQIRKNLKHNTVSAPYKQYNAIMLMRILVDNPGKSFTKHLDKKFVANVKTLLEFRGGDPSVQQILRETLEAFEIEKSSDTNLEPLITLWKEEKQRKKQRGQSSRAHQQRAIAASYVGVYPAPGQLYQQGPPLQSGSHGYAYGSQNPGNDSLPGPEELAGRNEEARVSAELLKKFTESTPPSEFMHHELIKEFANRCEAAQRSMRTYMKAKNPAPDEQTFRTLLGTNNLLDDALRTYGDAQLAAIRYDNLRNSQHGIRNETASATNNRSSFSATNDQVRGSEFVDQSRTGANTQASGIVDHSSRSVPFLGPVQPRQSPRPQPSFGQQQDYQKSAQSYPEQTIARDYALSAQQQNQQTPSVPAQWQQQQQPQQNAWPHHSQPSPEVDPFSDHNRVDNDTNGFYTRAAALPWQSSGPTQKLTSAELPSGQSQQENARFRPPPALPLQAKPGGKAALSSDSDESGLYDESPIDPRVVRRHQPNGAAKDVQRHSSASSQAPEVVGEQAVEGSSSNGGYVSKSSPLQQVQIPPLSLDSNDSQPPRSETMSTRRRSPPPELSPPSAPGATAPIVAPPPGTELRLPALDAAANESIATETPTPGSDYNPYSKYVGQDSYTGQSGLQRQRTAPRKDGDVEPIQVAGVSGSGWNY